MPPDPDLRLRLAAAQADLLASLLDGSEPPAGFDGERISATGLGLAAKRRRSVGHAWPALAAGLGAEFVLRFGDFSRGHPQREGASALEDGLVFADWLAQRGRLPLGGRLERCGVHLRYRLRGGHLQPRNGIAMRLCHLGPWDWLLALRLPGGREFWWRRSRPRP